jgi:hypothetical protein
MMPKRGPKETDEGHKGIGRISGGREYLQEIKFRVILDGVCKIIDRAGETCKGHKDKKHQHDQKTVAFQMIRKFLPVQHPEAVPVGSGCLTFPFCRKLT